MGQVGEKNECKGCFNFIIVKMLRKYLNSSSDIHYIHVYLLYLVITIKERKPETADSA